MKMWLYKRCKLYRSIFAEELYTRRCRRVEIYRRSFLLKQMEDEQRVFQNQIEAKDYSKALLTAASYFAAFNKYIQ